MSNAVIRGRKKPLRSYGERPVEINGRRFDTGEIMKRTIIIFAIIGIFISTAVTVAAQNKGRGRARQNIHVDGMSGNDTISVARRRPSNVTDGTSNTMMTAARKNSITIGGTRTGSASSIHGGSLADERYTRRTNAVTFEGNDEPLWVRNQRNSSDPANAVGTAQNVGPQINGNVRTKGFTNTTFDDQAARSSLLVQGNQIGTDICPRRIGLFGDSNGNGQVGANDYALKGSGPKTTIPAERRSGISGGDFNTEGPTTVGRSSLNNASRPQSFLVGTYERGNRR